MLRVAVCLIFIAIFHNGILYTQADETTTNGVPKNNETVTTKPTEDAPVTENSTSSSTTEATKSIDTSTVKQNITKRATDENQTTVRNPQEDVKDDKESSFIKGKAISGLITGDPAETTKVIFDIPKNIFDPVHAARVKISEAVSKGFDTAKEIAGETINFLRNTVKGAF